MPDPKQHATPAERSETIRRTAERLRARFRDPPRALTEDEKRRMDEEGIFLDPDDKRGN